MKVIICAGQVGTGIAERLASEGNSVSIIDASAELVHRANDVLEVRAIHGNAAHPDVLEKAGAREADMLIAVTLHDEVNMVSCQVAHTLFDIPTKIARVRAQTYLEHEWSGLFSREALAIDFIISPEIEVGNMILRRLQQPGAFDAARFADGRIAALGINCGVLVFDEPTPLELIKFIRPDVLVKGADWKKEDIVGYDLVIENGGIVETIGYLEGYSTTALEQKILKSHQ